MKLIYKKSKWYHLNKFGVLKIHTCLIDSLPGFQISSLSGAQLCLSYSDFLSLSYFLIKCAKIQQHKVDLDYNPLCIRGKHM